MNGIWEVTDDNHSVLDEIALKAASDAKKEVPKTELDAQEMTDFAKRKVEENPYPTEGDHRNKMDLSYDAMWLGELSELEDMTSKIDPAKLRPSELSEYYTLLKYLAQNSYYTYFKMTFPASDPLIDGKHVRLLCNILTRAERGDLKINGFTKIIITMPPRHLKSRTVSESFPSWFMAKDPSRHTIAVSYSADLGVKFGQKNKEKFETLGKDIFGAELSKDARSKSPWETSIGARFLGGGIGGSVTGFGADLLIVDDPFKNRQEADSKVIRKNVWQEWEDTLKTRIQGQKIVIVIHTRWHDDDLIGKLLKQEDAHEWLLVNLPAECEKPEVDLLSRYEGQPLWPENSYDNKYFDAYRKSPRTWAALYQQRPTISGGNLFKQEYFRYFEIDSRGYYVLHDGFIGQEPQTRRFAPHECWVFQTIDTALKEKEQSDSTGMLTVVVTPDWDLLFLDAFLQKLEVPKQPNAIMNYRLRFKPKYQIVENKQSGIFLDQLFQKSAMPLKTIEALRGKTERCFDILNLYEKGKVFHYLKMPNLDVLEEQLLKFPSAVHDDLVDTASYAGIHISDLANNIGIWESVNARR